MAASGTIPVHPSNQEQLRAWDGDEGAYWAANADRFERGLAGYDDALFAAAAIGTTDRVLDVGCGTGGTTRTAAPRAAGGSAVGVDLSSAMLEHARARASDDALANVEFVQADAQIHDFGADAFDVVIGRTSLMFVSDQIAAFTNIARALRSGGHLALLTWRPLSDNEWFREITGALAAGRDLPPPPSDPPGPFSLSDPKRIRALLAETGFVDVEIEAASEPMWFGDDADAAHPFLLGLLGWMLEGLDDRSRASASDALRASLAEHETTAGVEYGSGAWIVRATLAG